MSVQRSPTSSGTRPTTRSTARLNNNTREGLSEDEADQTLHPRISEDGTHYAHPDLDSRRSQSLVIRDALLRFGPGDLLKSDGSNFRTWYRELVEIAFSYLDNAEFFMREQLDSTMERVARSILLGSVNRSLRHELYDSRTSYGVVQILRTRFRTINQAAQLTRWSRLHRIDVGLDSNIPGLATTYRNTYADFLESGLELNEDNVLGLPLQSSICNNTDLRNEFDNRVDTVLSWNQDQPLTFNRLVDILISSQERVNDRLGDQRQEATPVAYNTDVPAPERQDSIISHPDNIYAQAARPSRPLPNRSISAPLQNQLLVPNSKLTPDLVGLSPWHLASLPTIPSSLPQTFHLLLTNRTVIPPGPPITPFVRRTCTDPMTTVSRLNVASHKWVFPFPIRPRPTTFHSLPPTVVTTLQASPTATPDPFSYVIPVSDKPLVDAPSLTVNEKYLLQLHRQFGHVSLRVLPCMISDKPQQEHAFL
ncbi:hypothetical protein PSHT_09491 [Puccinia striiformis]|uniref:Uncharacterized protein n=1 Tax=Puccinia striiformis TaxID=27350 RepID=A0A2S4VGE2_9BASI|nr:hypothetical protein PSHT_09491 [Puccinia striiformis]